MLLLVGATPAAAAASWATRLQAAQISVLHAERAVADWSFQSNAAVAILVITVLAGALTVIVQAVEKPWKRIATVIFGAVVTAITVIETATLDGDFKTMNARAKQGQQFVETARYWLDKAPQATSDDDRNVCLEEVSKALTSFSQVSTSKVNASLWPLETALYAQEDCGCLKDSAKEAAYRYFCGVGTDETLSVARSKASEKALKAAVKALAVKGSTDNSSLQAYLHRVATQVDSCVQPGMKQPSFSVMIRVPDNLTDARAQEAFVAPNKSLVANAHGQIAVPAGIRRSLDVRVTATPPSAGDFIVRLVPLGARGQSGYAVKEIEVVEDGSKGATRWEFTFIANTNEVGKLSSQSYKDGTDNVVRFAADQSPNFVLPTASSHLTIQGFRR